MSADVPDGQAGSRALAVVPFDPGWATLFEVERQALQALVGDQAMIHHIGSTAVAGMMAKPTIDILIEMQDPARVDAMGVQLLALGYAARGENGIAGRRYYVKGSPQRTHHLHVYAWGRADVRRHLVLRDYLRRSEQARDRYAAGKLEAAAASGSNVHRYAAYKAPLVAVLEAEALSAASVSRSLGFEAGGDPMPWSYLVPRLLSEGVGQGASVCSFKPFFPRTVARLRIAGGPPATVVIKWQRYAPRGADAGTDTIREEVAALEFLAQTAFTRMPRLLAAGASALLLEDLAPRLPLDALLVDRGQEGCRQQLLDYARTLGELGACTVGLRSRYEDIRAQYGLAPQSPADLGLGPGWPALRDALAAQSLAPPAAAAAELEAIDELLSAPGSFLAFSNGDVQVNNFLVGEGHGDGRLIDFEGGSFRHALALGVLIHTPGTAWITVSDPFAQDLEQVFREALVAGIPEAADEHRFGEGFAAASLAWAATRLTRLALLDTRPAGHGSRLQMVSTLEAAAGVARRHHQWLHAADWMQVVATRLRRRWTDTDIDLGALKPYTPRR